MTCWSIKERRTKHMAGYNYAQNIIGLKKGAGDIHELELEVAQLSAFVLTIGEKVEDISTYSTDEKIVGTWVDGSPIYEKTYTDVMPTVTEGNFSTKIIDTSTENIKLVIDYDMFVIQVFDGKQNTVKMPYITNGGYQLKGFYDATNDCINISSNTAAYSEKTIYATLRYIKNNI